MSDRIALGRETPPEYFLEDITGKASYEGGYNPIFLNMGD
jgi:hypothetical protein